MGAIYKLKKISSAIVELLAGRGRCCGEPKLIMTLLVKNEEHLLEKNILFHRKMGVDAFIITDNNSTDSTPEIIQKYMDKGWVVESIKEPGNDYNQKVWVDRMIWSAKRKHGAAWIINADADEFWYSPQGSLKAEMKGRENVLRCRVVNVCPEEGVDFSLWDKVARPIPEIEKYELSRYTIFKRYTYKVAHTAAGYIKISMGNHKVTMLPSRKRKSEITIYHYNILGREEFVKKMKNGGEQIEQNPKKSVARHWRYFYELYKSGAIEQEYDRVVGLKYREEFQEKGYLYHDSSVADILKEVK